MNQELKTNTSDQTRNGRQIISRRNFIRGAAAAAIVGVGQEVLDGQSDSSEMRPFSVSDGLRTNANTRRYDTQSTDGHAEAWKDKADQLNKTRVDVKFDAAAFAVLLDKNHADFTGGTILNPPDTLGRPSVTYSSTDQSGNTFRATVIARENDTRDPGRVTLEESSSDGSTMTLLSLDNAGGDIAEGWGMALRHEQPGGEPIDFTFDTTMIEADGVPEFHPDTVGFAAGAASEFFTHVEKGYII